MKIQIPDIYEDIFEPRRYKVYFGGRGASKSWTVARVLLVKAKVDKLRILCAREIQRSIRDSVHRLLKDQIYELQLDKEYNITDNTIRHVNGSEFIFAGLHNNIANIKSLEGVDICWIEEGHSVSEDSWQFLVPTIRKEGSEIWLTFNRDRLDDPCYKRFVEKPRENSIIKKVNYYDNPFFPETLREEMEWDKKNDYEKYLHVWEGEPLKHSEAQVFKNKWRVEDFETPNDVTFYHGCDWGFSSDPTALIRCFIVGKKIYIDQEVYGRGIDIDKLPERFDYIETAKKWQIIADSARPETISYMRMHGYPNVIPCKKWTNCKEERVEFLKSFEEIVIHERCKNTKIEFATYSYKRDLRTGDILPKLEDKNDHGIDALAYSLDKAMRHKQKLGISASDLGL